jgi:prophage regulatory protein
MLNAAIHFESILRLREVRQRVGLSRSTIYALAARGDFPAPVKLGARAAGWLESEIAAWIAGRVKTRRA